MAPKLRNSRCIFCYEEVDPSGDDVEGTKRFGEGSSSGSQAKFLLLLTRYLKFQDFVEGRYEVPLSELRLCWDCSRLGDSFCELFLQLEALQLQLNWKLRRMCERISTSDQIPVKLNQFRKQFECPSGSPNKSGKEVEEQRNLQTLGKDIQNLRKELLHHCELNLNPGQQPTPKVVLKRTPPEKRVIKIVTVRDDEAAAENEQEILDENDDLDYGDDDHIAESGMEVDLDGYSCSIIKQEDRNTGTGNEFPSPSPPQENGEATGAPIPTRKSRRILLKRSTAFGHQSKVVSHSQGHHQDEVDENTEELNAPLENESDGDYDVVQENIEDDEEDNQTPETSIAKSNTQKWTRPDMLPSTKCEVCQQSFISEAAVEKHRVLTHKLTKFLRCQGCGLNFSSFDSLRNHRSNPNISQCFIKTIKFLEPASKSEFPRYFTGSENKFCPKEGCFEIFTHDQHLEIHLKTHGEWNCLYCEMKFEKAHLLALHEVTQHNEEGSQTTDSSGETSYKCNRCVSKKKYRKRWLLFHFLTKHLGISKVPENSEVRNQCPICKRIFHVHMQKKELELHIKVEHEVDGLDPSKVLRCKVCQVPFTTPRMLTQHVKLIHKTARMYPCLECGKEFRLSSDLRYHCRKVHQGSGLVGNHQCNLCNENFTMEYMLESHMRMHARREKSFPCKECGKVFPRADTLRRHVQSKHEPEETMPYCCDHCGKMFGRKDRLVQHARTHFTQSESFDCHLCGATFRHESKLKSHMEKMHETTTDSGSNIILQLNADD